MLSSFRVDDALVSALQDKNTPVVERPVLRAVRVFVFVSAVMWSAVASPRTEALVLQLALN